MICLEANKLQKQVNNSIRFTKSLIMQVLEHWKMLKEIRPTRLTIKKKKLRHLKKPMMKNQNYQKQLEKNIEQPVLNMTMFNNKR